MKQPFKTISLLISASTLVACSTPPSYDYEPDYYTYVDAFTCHTSLDHDKKRPVDFIAYIEPIEEMQSAQYEVHLGLMIFDQHETSAMHVRNGLTRIWYWGFDEDNTPAFAFMLHASGIGYYATHSSDGDDYEVDELTYQCEQNVDLEIEVSDRIDRTSAEQEQLKNDLENFGPIPDFTIDDNKLSM